MDERAVATTTEMRPIPRTVEVMIRRLSARHDELLLEAQAMSLAIERLIEQACAVSLDNENWTLNLDEGRLEREVAKDGGQSH